jgi:acetylornithine deacetylase/succinyl-diaminopimelate desuccinylase family protein
MSDAGDMLMQLIEQRRGEAVHLLRELIQIPSQSGEESRIAYRIAERMRGFGFENVLVDELFNVICTVGGSVGSPSFLLNGHIDTVPVGELSLWPHDPSTAPIIDGAVVGRGACDMKGAVAAMMIAADSVIKTGVKLRGDLILTFVVREEGGQQEGTKFCIENGGLKPDIALVGEATDLNFCLGSRGRIVVDVSVRGKSAHAANASKGINAVVKMSKMIEAVNRMKLPMHEIFGATSQTITNISCRPGQLNMVPDLCTISIDRRISPGDSLEKTKEEFEDLVAAIRKDDADFSAEVETGKFAMPGYKPPDQDVMQRLRCAAEQVLRRKTKTGRYIFGTDGSYLSGVADIPWFGFGPGNEADAHTVNDRVLIEDLVNAAKVYAHFIVELLA